MLGGEEGWDKYHKTIEMYDAIEDKWSYAGELPTPRSSLSCISLQVFIYILFNYHTSVLYWCMISMIFPMLLFSDSQVHLPG